MLVTSYSSPLFFGANKSKPLLSASSQSSYSSINAQSSSNSNVSTSNSRSSSPHPRESEGIVREAKKFFRNNWKNMLGILGGTGLFAGYVATNLDHSIAWGYAPGSNSEYQLLPDGNITHKGEYKGRVNINGDVFDTTGCLTSIVKDNPKNNDSMLLHRVFNCDRNATEKKAYARSNEDIEEEFSDFNTACLDDPKKIVQIETFENNPNPRQMAGFGGGMLNDLRLCVSKMRNILKNSKVKKKQQPRRITNS